LAAPGGDGVARRHVDRRVLVRAQHGRRKPAAVAAELRHRLDQRRMVGAEVAEQVVEADLVQAFEKVVRGRVPRLVAVHRGPQSSLMLALAATAFQRTMSRAISSRNSLVLVERGSTKIASSAARTGGISSVSSTTSCRRSTISMGVPLGATMPVHSSNSMSL